MLEDVVIEAGEFRAHRVSSVHPGVSGESVGLDMNLHSRLP